MEGSPMRYETPARRRVDEGAAMLWSVVIVVAVLAILAGIAGPRVGGLIGRATELSLSATVRSAARSLQEVYDEGGITADDVNADGSPKPALLARLGAADSAEGLDWRTVWAYDDENHVVRVQFIADGLENRVANRTFTALVHTSALPPTVPWLSAGLRPSLQPAQRPLALAGQARRAPSRTRDAPVRYSGASRARKATVSATSSGSARRPIGTWSITSGRWPVTVSVAFRIRSAIGEST